MTVTPDVAVVDAGMGNLTSVANALRSIGARVTVMDSPSQLATASHVVLPGVGAFGDAMVQLRAAGWVDALRTVVAAETPLLGICLGMQLFAAVGLEHGEHEGLGWIDGQSLRLDAGPGHDLRIPHVGWNTVVPTRRCRLYAGIEDASVFYFLHSYRLAPVDEAVVSGWCEYGTPFVASVHRGSVYGVQFHPEKSHRAGLRLLRNFLADDEVCEC